jgi:Mce-associated membrane protein
MTEDQGLENEPSGAEPARRRTGFLRRAAAGLLVAVLLAALVVGWLRLQDRQELVDAGREAEAAARAAVTNMLTYDYRHLDEDFAWVERDGTDAFVEAFQASADNVREIADATSAVSTATIVRSGVHVEDGDQASALVVADSDITKATGLPIQNRWFVSVTLVNEDGRWLVDAIELL